MNTTCVEEPSDCQIRIKRVTSFTVSVPYFIGPIQEDLPILDAYDQQLVCIITVPLELIMGFSRSNNFSVGYVPDSVLRQVVPVYTASCGPGSSELLAPAFSFDMSLELDELLHDHPNVSLSLECYVSSAEVQQVVCYPANIH